MPYTGISDPKLPDNIKKLSADQRRRWVGTWNGAFSNCRSSARGGGAGSVQNCEKLAFRVANSTLSKEVTMPDEDVKDKNMDSMELPYGGATSFEALEAWREAREQALDLDITTSDAQDLIRNIMHSEDIEDKPSAIVKIGNDLGARLAALAGKAKEFFSDKQATKTEEGVQFKAADYAVVPDREKPSTWKLRLAEERSGNFTVTQVARAITAMQPGGFRGQRVELGAGDKTQAVNRITAVIGKLDATDDQKESLKSRLSRVKDSSFELFKDKDGNWRWFAMVSNKFRDLDHPPEIIEDKAHREYIEYLEKSGNYPEAWLWHTPGTKWGKADWADYVNGFLCMSGQVDEGMEPVAQKLADDPDLGVSHGFNYWHSDKEKGIIGWYRCFEISPLPLNNAANPWTSIAVIKKEYTDMFDEKKRPFLVDKLGEDRVKHLEDHPAELEKALSDMGIEWKEGDKKEPEAVVQPTIDADEIANKSAKALLESEGFKNLAEMVKGSADKLTEFESRVKALERSDDEKVAGVISAAIQSPGGYRASKAEDNLVKDGDPIGDAKPDPGWLRDALGPFAKV